MITLYTWTTPNGRKASIALEELELPYEVVPVNIARDEQFTPDFLRISPNNKIPAIVDGDAGGLSVFESGAILIHLAEKAGQLLPASGPARAKTLEWLFWQVGGLGPMLGQLGFFAARAPEKVPLAINRFDDESRRLLGVMNKRLGEEPYLAGADYSIADIACYAWTHAASTMLARAAPGLWEGHPNLERWLAEVGARPAVGRGMAVPQV